MTESLHDAIISAFSNYLINSRKSTGEFVSKDKKFYMSDLGKCQRMRYLKRKGIEGEYGVDAYYTFAHGDFIHTLGYKALEAADMLVATEQRLENEHFVCRYDGILRYQGDNVMFDFKSTNPYIMKRITSGAGDNIENIMQVLGAILLAREDTTHMALSDTAAVVYVNKLPSEKIDPTIIKPRIYHLNTYKEEIKEDMQKMVDYWLADTIPACTCPSWAVQKYNAYFLFCRMPEKEVGQHLKYLKKNKITSDGFRIHIQPLLGKEDEVHGE